MNMNSRLSFLVSACSMLLTISCTVSPNKGEMVSSELTTVGNPYLPLWEHIPDGEPYVFEDPDHPGHYRVYIYGSHDNLKDNYCGLDQVVWSASVDSLNCWRYDGVIFSVDKNADGKLLNADGKADLLYAPDVTMVTAADGTKTYYLYPNDQHGGRNGLVARSSRPDGPFEVCNWSKTDPMTTDGVLKFDPAVFVDSDGRVYGYWGFERSYAAELDPATMATVKPGTEIIEDMVSARDQEGPFRFFEASSIRKIKDKYVFIYSRWTADGEFSLPATNYTLAYAYSDQPLGPWTYGGTIIDGRGRETNEQGDTIASATVSGNTHGSICEINGQWYVFYHRQTGTNEFARQAMVAPITVNVEEGPGGRVTISEGEYNSEGFSLEGLNPLERHSAGLACWYTGPKPAIHEWPNKTFFGSYVDAGYGTSDNFQAPYDLRNNSNPVVNNTDGSIVGYKYFNFDATKGRDDVQLLLNIIPEGIDGTITVMADRPWTSQGGVVLGTLQLRADMTKQPTEFTIPLPQLGALAAKHALFFTFSSEVKEQSLCQLLDFVFQ
ncbi:MAG: family 43 glycosylhydrolase [Prevotella sp.]|nr:family 43 glycosylhydrolase [Prevotella sp.]